MYTHTHVHTHTHTHTHTHVQLFLGCLPEERSQWIEATQKSREQYEILKKKVMCTGRGGREGEREGGREGKRQKLYNCIGLVAILVFLYSALTIVVFPIMKYNMIGHYCVPVVCVIA